MHRREFLVGAAGALGCTALSCAASRGSSSPSAGGSAGSSPLDLAAFQAARRFASTQFGRIAYVERGAGPAALFIHGLPLNGFQWRGALERLSPHRRCLAPDSMGLGYSEIPAGQDLAPEAQVDMLAAFLDALAIRVADIVASDSGGAVAQIFAVRYPERVRTLLLTNCDVHEDSPPPLLLPVIAAARAGRFADETLVPQIKDKALARAPEGLGGFCYAYPANLADDTIDYYLKPLVSSPLRVEQLHRYIVALERNPLVALEPALKRCQAPLRVIWGMRDPIFHRSSPDWLDRTFPRSRGVRRLADAKLFFPEELPDVVAEEARQLWLHS